MYQKLLEDISVLNQRTARFRKVALHVHSPDSRDWPRQPCDELKNDRNLYYATDGSIAFAEELSKHLNLVAVTDHMRCSYACHVSQNAHRSNDLVVLPGMEVNFRPKGAYGVARIHLLVIFPEGSIRDNFERLFEGLNNIPDDTRRTGNEEVSGISLSDWVERVHRQQGICIAAHVDNNQGARRQFRYTAKGVLSLFSDEDGEQLEKYGKVHEAFLDYLLDSKIDAVEIARTHDLPHYRWVTEINGETRSIPTILTFDAHRIEDFDQHDRITYMKMTDLGIQGLRDALTFPETRIRFEDNLPQPPSPCLLGISVEGGDTSFFSRLLVAFTPDLNCLIGPRGAGKSTLVEALRYVFGYNLTLNELGKSAEGAIRALQRANLPDSLIRVVYQTSQGDIRVLQATFDEDSDYSTKVYSKEGDFLEVANVEESRMFPLRLFGWNEIETLGRDPAKQRDLLDRLIPELIPVLAKREEIRNELHRSRGVLEQAIQELQAAYRASDNEITRYTEYKQSFEKLDTPEVQRLFSAFDLAQRKLRLLEKVKANANGLIEKLGDPAQLSLTTDLQSLLEEGGQALSDWWQGEEIRNLKVLEVCEDVKAEVRIAVQKLETFITQVVQHLGTLRQEILDIEKGIREQTSDDSRQQKVVDLRENAEKRLRHTSTLREVYLKAFERLREAIRTRKEITDELKEVHNEIAGIRAKSNERIEERLNHFLPDDMNVSIDFRAGRDTGDFETRVGGLFSKVVNTYKRRQLPGAVAENYDPIEFARMLANGELEDLVGQHASNLDERSAFNETDVTTLLSKMKPFERNEHAEVTILADDGSRLRGILDLQEVPWDDLETIRLNGQPVNETSPGQRSSAMLPLIALAEEAPLIIDQPEDNLDKRLISKVLVKVLADLKERRQIIVCTHDPNILVGGDAEQVIVLEAESDRHGKVALHGSIDNADIVQTVIDLLEGGREAFEVRRKRYE